MKARAAILLASVFLLAACSKKDERLAPIPFQDDFERPALGDNWTGDPGWRIKDGAAYSAGTSNRPLFLKARLPDDAVIELDVRSESPAGDIKFELYTDGKSHESGYILILGGWKNTISCIARQNEHGHDRQELKQPGLVKLGQTHHMKVVRQDKVMRWYVDGSLLLDYYDSDPLRGDGHDRLALNNWQSHLYFDNLKIRTATPEDK